MNKLVQLLENDSVEIIFKHRLPYLCMGPTDEYGLISKIEIGDHNVTGYNGLGKENVSQELMNKIKKFIILAIKDSEYQ